MFVGICEESDEGRERVSKVADRGRDGESVISGASKNLGMDIMSDNSGMSDVDWNHGFLHGSIKYDLGRFGIAKDIELCEMVKIRMRINFHERIYLQPRRDYQYRLLHP